MPMVRLFAVMTVCTGLVTGCGFGDGGPPRHGIAGKISFDGQPVSQGAITFIPAEGTSGPSGGSRIENGSYTVPLANGLVAGTYRVEIRSPQKTGKQIPAQSPSPPGTMTDEIKETIPAIYNKSSEVTVKIPAAGDQFNLELKSP